jgi:hypothetical protein
MLSTTITNFGSILAISNVALLLVGLKLSSPTKLASIV